MPTWRFEVRPRPDLPDPVGQATLASLHRFGLTDVSAVRTARLYLVDGLDSATGPTSARPAASADLRSIAALLTDPVSEQVVCRGLEDAPPAAAGAFEVFFLPGVMDAAGQTAAAAVRTLGRSVESVRTGRRFEIAPVPDAESAARITRLLGNGSVEEVVRGTKPIGPPVKPGVAPFDLRTISLGALSDAELDSLSRRAHLFLSTAEMRAIADAFAALGRDPTDLELETLAQTWSEHCVHKTIKSEIIYRGAPLPMGAPGQPPARDAAIVELRYANLLKETIVRATHALIAARRGPECLSVFVDNAGIIGFDEQLAIAVKVETHNHPSAIEPYGGAATGLGGCIRDVIGAGLGAKPVASTDVFCVAPADWPAGALPDGVLHPRQVLAGVVAGVRDYGNRMGIPTVNGAILFEPRYLANPLVFCGTIGLVPRDRVRKAARAGDAVVLVGGRTGRDGIHGATFSSASLAATHADEFAHAVQIGNAIEEKKFLDVILQARDADGGCLYSAITDCGAGGLSSAIGEMAADTGAEIDLDRVPLKYVGLRYDEIWISESQERMVLAVPQDRVDALLALARNEDVEATVIGRFTGQGRLVVKFDQRVVGDLPMALLHEGRPRETRTAEWFPAATPPAPPAAPIDFAAELRRRLADPNVASKEWVIRQYDHEVQGGSVVKPLVGRHAIGPSDAAVIRPRLDSPRGLAIGCGICPHRSDDDPYWMAWAAVDEALRNVVCVGGDPDRTAILDNFCWGSTADPRELGGLVRACQACHDAALAYGLPFISGKDSLNNAFDLSAADRDRLARAAAAHHRARLTGDRLNIPGTLLVTAVSLIDDVRRCITMDLKPHGGALWLVGQPTRFTPRDPAQRPAFDPRGAHATHRGVAELIRSGLASAAHDVSDGGLLVACAEMALAGDRSCALLEDDSAPDPALWFDDSPALYLVELRRDREAEAERRLAAVPARRLAQAAATAPGDAPQITLPGPHRARTGAASSITLDALRRLWRTPPGA
ncbi:MAG: AIR synthase-related protein [Phycisphaerae bacterium]